MRKVLITGISLCHSYTAKPDDISCKLSDVSRLHALGWRHRIGLEEGIGSTYEWYLEKLA